MSFQFSCRPDMSCKCNWRSLLPLSGAASCLEVSLIPSRDTDTDALLEGQSLKHPYQGPESLRSCFGKPLAIGRLLSDRWPKMLIPQQGAERSFEYNVERRRVTSMTGDQQSGCVWRASRGDDELTCTIWIPGSPCC